MFLYYKIYYKIIYIIYPLIWVCVQWFSLDDIAKGKLHLKIEWLSLLSTPDKLDEVT